MIAMNKEEFGLILERQQQSGLSVRDFCSNEGYILSSFHYWKSKFGFCRTASDNKHARVHGQEDKFIPIRIDNLPVMPNLPKAVPESSNGEIKIKLPNGTQLSFRGNAQLEIAIHLLNKICSSYVQPE